MPANRPALFRTWCAVSDAVRAVSDTFCADSDTPEMRAHTPYNPHAHCALERAPLMRTVERAPSRWLVICDLLARPEYTSRRLAVRLARWHPVDVRRHECADDVKRRRGRTC